MPARPYRVAPLQEDAYTWAFPGGPLRIKIPHKLITRLRAEIDEHRKQQPDAARTEIGGVLLGCEGDFPDTLEIEDYICLSSTSPEGHFNWSAAAFQQAGGPHGEKRKVGYFRTELGDTLSLRDDELAIVQREFSDRTNVVLLAHSGADDCIAGFLFWDGDVFTPFSFMNFPFDVETLKREASERSSEAIVVSDGPEPAHEAVPEAPPEPVREPASRRKEEGPVRLSTKTLWMLGAALFGLTAGVVILGMYYLLPSLELATAHDSLQLDVMAQAEGIHVRWNPQSRVIGRAREGRLVVADGDRQIQVVPLDKDQLKSGHVYYEPSAERTEFHLEVTDETGHVFKESVIVLSPKSPASGAQPPGGRGQEPADALPGRRQVGR